MRALNRIRAAIVGVASAATVVALAPAALAYNSAVVVGSTAAWVPNGAVHSVVTDGTTVWVGGAFTGGVVALSADGGQLLWQGTADGDVTALALYNGHLLMGGAFNSVGGATHRKLASVNATTGAVDTGYKAAAGGTVRDIVVVGTTEYFGGAFTNHGGMTQTGLGAVDVSSGKVVTTFTPSTTGNVYALATDGTRLFVGGMFTGIAPAAGQTALVRNELASVTLATNLIDAWAPAAACTGCNVVWDMTLDTPNHRLYTAGRNAGFMYTVDSVSGARIYKLAANGDSQAITLGPDGNVYVGGHFTTVTVGSVTSSRIIVAGFSVGPTVKTPVLLPFSARFVTTYPGVWAMGSNGGHLYVGGAFTAAGPKVSGANAYPYFANFPA
jgi:hypothetical protein